MTADKSSSGASLPTFLVCGVTCAFNTRRSEILSKQFLSPITHLRAIAKAVTENVTSTALAVAMVGLLLSSKGRGVHRIHTVRDANHSKNSGFGDSARIVHRHSLAGDQVNAAENLL